MQKAVRLELIHAVLKPAYSIFSIVKHLIPNGKTKSQEEPKETITSILTDFGPKLINNYFNNWAKRLLGMIDQNEEYVI